MWNFHFLSSLKVAFALVWTGKLDNEFKLLRWLLDIIFLALQRSTQLKPNFMPQSYRQSLLPMSIIRSNFCSFHEDNICFWWVDLRVHYVLYNYMSQQYKIIPLFKNCEVEYPNMIFYFKIWSKNVINKITAFWDFFKNYDIPAFVRFRPLTNR